MTPQTQENQVFPDWNNTRTSYPRDKSIHELFEAQVERTPEALALRFGDRQVTYAELNSRSNQMAHYLRGMGVGRGDLVGICLERSVLAITGMLAILKSEGAYLPLDPTYPAERLALMTEDAKARLLLTDTRLADDLPRNGARVVLLDAVQQDITRQPTGNLTSAVEGNDLAYVIYTSGSTGQPKGICIPHRAVNRLVINTNYIQPGPRDRIAQASNTSFDAATFEIWGALLTGACVVGITKESTLSPRHLVADIEKYGVTVLFLTTALFNQVARELPAGFHSLDTLLFGGEAVDPQLVKRVVEHGPPARLLHVYGPTESTTFSSWYLVEQVEEGAKTIPIGRAISNTQMFVLDEHLAPVAPGNVGEIHVGGDGLADGYLGRPDATTEKFIPDPFDSAGKSRLYKTGDVGRLLVDGNIEFVGRVDNQIKLRGFRIELEEIEAVLVQHHDVREAVILVQQDCTGDKSLVAYVVGKSGAALSVSELRRHLKQRLPNFMVPARFAILEEMPLTPNGKVDRKSLPAVKAVRPNLDSPYVAPLGELEQAIANVWRDVLGIERVGVNDNFFELGGHSLGIAQCHSRVQEHISADIPVTLMFQYPTIRALSEHLNQAPIGATVTSSSFQAVRDRAQKQRNVLSQNRRVFSGGKSE